MRETQQRLYTTFVETFVVTLYPQLNVRFVNSGWGGENAPGGNGGPAGVRLTREAIPYKLTQVVRPGKRLQTRSRVSEPHAPASGFRPFSAFR